jgi:hypothetical protein
MSISREKYEKAKNAARDWYSMLQSTNDMLEELQTENQILRKEVEILKSEVDRWKNFSENLPDQEENDTLKKTVKTLEKQLRRNEENFKIQLDQRSLEMIKKLDNLEREKLLSETRYIALEESRKELYERHQDLKKEMKELQQLYSLYKKN